MAEKYVQLVQKVFGILAKLCYFGILLLLCVTAPYIAGYRPTVILSGSMEPAIMTGDMVYVKNVENYGKLKTGDVIAFQRQQDATPITHRIVKLNEKEQTIITKGDANESEDGGYVTFAQVRGKVSGIRIPKAGCVIQYVKHPFIIGIVAFIIIINFILGDGRQAEEAKVSKRETRKRKKGKRKEEDK